MFFLPNHSPFFSSIILCPTYLSSFIHSSMVSSTDPSQGNKPDEIFTTNEIVDIISNSLTRLRSSLPVNNGSNTINAAIDSIASNSDSQLMEKVCNDLNYMKYAYERLKEHEKDVSKPILTLKRNLESILESNEIDHKMINRIVKDIGNLNSQIPHARKMTSSRVGAHQYLQTNDRSGTRRVPNLHFKEAFRSDSSYEELERLFETLETEQKLCLLCFAVFPENALVKRRFLMYWWVGERLLDNPAEQKADEVLQVLMRKGFIEPVNKKRELIINSFRMQPLVRSAVIMLAKKHMFFDYDDNGNPTANSSMCKRACWVKLGDGTSGKPLVNGTNADRESSRNIWGNGVIKNPEELQTLFNVNEPYPDIPSDLFSKMKELSVLCLGRWEKLDVKKTTEQHIEVESSEFLKGLTNMRNLRLLSFQGVSRLEKFPSSRSKFSKLVSSNVKLSNLRILDLRACQSLEVLPDWLQFLTNLTHLDISECVLLNRLPKALVSLSNLQVLKGFVVSDDKKKENACSLADLAKLKKLRKLSIYVHKDFSIEKGSDALKNLEELKTLSISWGAANTSKRSKSAAIQNVTNPDKKGEKKHKVSGDVKKKPEKEIGDGKKQKAGSSEIHERKREQENVAAEQHPSNTKARNAETGEGKKQKGGGDVKKTVKILDFKDGDGQVVKSPETRDEEKGQQNIAAEQHPSDIKATNAETGERKKQKGSGDVKKNVTILETREGDGHVAKSPERRNDEKGRQNISPIEPNAGNTKSRDEKAEQDSGAAKLKPVNSETTDDKMQQGSRPPQPARSGSMSKAQNPGDKRSLLNLPSMKKAIGLGPKESEGPTIVLPQTLEKLDLRCYPVKEKPSWLMPQHLNKLNKLCIRGGSLASLGEVQETGENKWNVKILHLKYLDEMKLDWNKLQVLFPHLEYLEKFKCPKISFCPCDIEGVWLKS